MTNERIAKIAELKSRARAVGREFTEALRDFNAALAEYLDGRITERELDVYSEYACELQDEFDELKAELKTLLNAA